MRLNKFLTNAGIASRRAADHLIQSGTTTVNGILQLDPATAVSPRDDVRFDGQKVSINNERLVIALHKPKGYITTAKDPRKRTTVMALIPKSPGLFAIGRLDRNSTGLLLFTNDGELAQQLLLPKNRISRIYKVEINHPLDRVQKQKLNKGIFIDRGQMGRARVLKQVIGKKSAVVRLELTQGKNREIRRIMNTLDKKVYALKRISIGPIQLNGLAVGQWRRLNKKEIQQLQYSLKNRAN